MLNAAPGWLTPERYKRIINPRLPDPVYMITTNTKETRVLFDMSGRIRVWTPVILGLLPFVMGVQPNRSPKAIKDCRSIQGDDTWPSHETWNELNQTIGGRLIATVPQAAVCHSGGYGPLKQNATACSILRAGWNDAMT